MNRRFLFLNQSNISLRSAALGTSLVFAGVLLVNYASNEYRLISMDFETKEDSATENSYNSNLKKWKGVGRTALSKCQKVTLGIILFVAIFVVILVIILVSRGGRPTETGGDEINNKDDSATNKTKQKPTSENNSSAKSSSENKMIEVVQYSLEPVAATAATVTAVYGLNKIMESSDSSKGKVKGKSTPRLANDTKLIQETPEIHKKDEEDRVGPQEVSNDQVATDNTKVVAQEASDTPENNDGEKTGPENLVVDSNLKQDNAKKNEDEGNKNEEEEKR